MPLRTFMTSVGNWCGCDRQKKRPTRASQFVKLVEVCTFKAGSVRPEDLKAFVNVPDQAAITCIRRPTSAVSVETREIKKNGRGIQLITGCGPPPKTPGKSKDRNV